VDLLRRHRLDTALLVLAAVVIVTSLGESLEHVRYGSALMAATLVVLLLRNVHPPAASVVAFGALAVGGRLTPQITPAMFLAILACFGVAGTLPRRREAVVAWVVGCVAMVTAMAGNPYVEGAGDIALTLTFCTVVWGAALVATERARQVDVARARVEHVELERELDIAAATGHERARIAGELHDIVSHGLSIVILQTVAARNALEDDAVPHDGAVDRRLDAVESTARQALADMRRLLDLLRLDVEPLSESLEPAASLRGLPGLVARAREAGQPVDVSAALAADDLPAGLDAAAYRIVQEALTNALKHAHGAATCVRVAHSSEELLIEVRNGRAAGPPLAADGAGYGLIGIRERARVYDGSLAAGADGDGFLVRATFPLGGRA
jgi:signal transduction histidine kinase